MKNLILILTVLVFSIVSQAQTITVTSPSGGDTLVGAQTYTITWTTTGTIDSVDIYYRRSGSLNLIQSSVANTGSYTWTVPSNILSSTSGYIRIKNYNSSLYDQNNSSFRFQEAPKSITVTYPNALTDTLQSGAPNTITWNSTGNINKVKIYYSLNGGASYALASSYYGVTNNGSFIWTPLNSKSSTQLRIKIEGYGYLSQYNDVSDTTSILLLGNTITLLSPLSANFVSGTTRSLSWTSSGNMPFVDLDYSINYGAFVSIADSTANTGSYNWTIPSVTGNTQSLRLRIREHGSSTVMNTYYNYSISSTPESITLFTPNGGQTFTEGDTTSISWTYSSNLHGYMCQFDYSIDSGASWNFIGDAMLADSSATWVVPLHVSSSNCLMRIWRHMPNIMAVSDTSNSVFTINLAPASIVMTSPNGGEKYLSADYKNVGYYTTGSLDSLDLYFSSNGGNNWSLLKTGISPLTTYSSFQYPDIHSNNCKLKLLAHNNTTVIDSSDNVFTLTRLKLKYPYPNNIYYAGSTKNITWNKSPLAGSSVSLFYSVDSGNVWNIIDTNVLNNGNYSWNVPIDSSTICLVKIIDNTNAMVVDISDGAFKILPSPIQITSPNGGEYINKQSYYPITWTTEAGINIYKVKIYYSTNGGTSWNSINSYWNNTGTYNWYTPNTISSSVLIKVENYYSGGSPSDVSDAVFNVGIALPNSITLISPNGGDTLPMTGIHNIIWTSTGSVDSVDLYYSVNKGITWTSIVNGVANNNTYAWSYSNINTDKAMIKVVEHGDNSIKDSSNAIFNMGYYVHLVSPNGGEVFSATTIDTIYWNAKSSLNSVNLDLYNGQGWSNIAMTVPNTGKYAWTVPNITCTGCKVRVKNGAVSLDESDMAFSISPYNGITLSSPNGGETLGQGSSYAIIWDTTGITSYVNLLLSIDSGLTWQNIISNYTNTGLYNWTVPTTILSSKCYVKISGTKNGVLSSDISNTVFNIIAPTGTISVITPNGGEAWYRHTASETIKWQKTGSVTSVDVLYSLNSGLLWDTLVIGSTADSIISWHIPFSTSLSDSCLIKVQDHNSPYINDISDSVFSIIEAIHQIYISSPSQGYPTWTEGQTNNISWTTNGVIPLVNIYVSNNSGTSYTLIDDSISNNMTSSNSYSWLVPHGLNHHNCKIKVEEVGNPSVNDINTLKITDSISVTVLSPNGGEVFNGMDSVSFLWAKTGIVSNIQLSFSVDSGLTWSYVIVLQDTINTFKFLLPNISTTNALFRLGYGYGLTDVSDSVFTINPILKSITVISPNGGGPYAMYGNMGIDWSSAGITQFNFYYSPDNGSSWLTAAGNNYGGPNHFNWSGPDRNIDSCLFKVVDADSSTVFDISDTAFAIVGFSDFTIKTPNGGQVFFNDSTYLIEWSHLVGWRQPTSHVNLKYSLDTGNTWLSITTHLNAITDSSYLWTVPSSINSSSCLIKVVDQYRSANYDISDSFFTIEPVRSISITSPMSNNLIMSDSSSTITWSNTGIISNVNLHYSLDSGLTWITIDSAQNNTGSYLWNTPIGIHSYVFIKVTDTQADTIFDISDLLIMTLKNTSLTITQPNGGDTLNGGQVYQVKWDWTGVFTTQWVLYYSIDSGTTWTFITDGNFNGMYSTIDKTINWTVPNMNLDTTFSNCLVRVISTASDTSDAVFAIKQEATNTYVRITSPNGGDSLVGGGIKTITWLSKLDSLSTDSLDIYFSSDSGATWTTIALFEDNDSTYSWAIPQISSTNCLIKMISSADSTVFDISDSVFTIAQSPFVQLTTVNGGIIYYSGGNPMKIYWNANLSSLSNDSLDIYFSSDSAVTWTNIANSVANSGLFSWPIPAISSTNCLIKIQSSANNTIFDISDSVFAIGIPNIITLGSPNGGEVLIAGATININWVAYMDTLANDSVDLFLSVDSALTWSNIAINENNDSTYSWIIPMVSSVNCLVKIQSNADSTIFDVSDAVFTITTIIPPSVSISSPSGGDTLTAGSIITIQWLTNFGSKGADSVNLYYTADSGSTWNVIALYEIDTIYAWTVPLINSKKCFIMIAKSADTTIADTSGMFSVRNSIGIKEQSIGEIKIFPNPTSSFINVSSTVKLNKIELFDLNGKLISTEYNKHSVSINVRSLPPGVYILRGYYEKGVFLRKIIKQ